MAPRIPRTAFATAFALLGALVPHGATADLVGRTDVRTAIADKSDEALIAANPVLQRMERESSALLGEVLERLRATPAEPSHRRSLVQAQPKPKPATQAETAVLAENPDLSQYHRESPEAALDLLRLIREAAKKQ